MIIGCKRCGKSIVKKEAKCGLDSHCDQCVEIYDWFLNHGVNPTNYYFRMKELEAQGFYPPKRDYSHLGGCV